MNSKVLRSLCLAISRNMPQDLRTMDQYWAWFVLTASSIESLINICIRLNHCSDSVNPFCINMCFGSAAPSIERMCALITCVICSVSSEWDTTGEEWREIEFIGFSKVRVGERGEKVLAQHNGLLFCCVSQYRRLSCQPTGALLIWLCTGGGNTPCCFNLLPTSNLIW